MSAWTPTSGRTPDAMPEICSFYGIVVRMYYDDHRPPHFHVSYQGADAVVRIDPLAVVRGDLPGRARAMVMEWGLAHREELRQNWVRAERGERIFPIAALE